MGLPAAAPPLDIKADAKALHKQHRIDFIEVLHVDTDSILFRGFNRIIRTAWLGVKDGRVVKIAAESGFPAEPSEWVVRMLAKAIDDEGGDRA